MGAQAAVTDFIQSLMFTGAPVLELGADPVRVETTTLLPGGALATLSVRRAPDGYQVSDDGAGRSSMLALGVQDLTRGDARRANDIATARGISFDGQGFSIVGVSIDQLTAAIAYVADASRAWAVAAIDARSARHHVDLTDRAKARLQASLPGLQIDADRELVGISTKRHRFDLVVALPGDRLALFETITPAPASMAAAHMKFFDLMQAHVDWPREAVVESLADWASEDLAVMQQVSSHVRGVESQWSDLQALAA